jgi:hypothetical protein
VFSIDQYTVKCQLPVIRLAATLHFLLHSGCMQGVATYVRNVLISDPTSAWRWQPHLRVDQPPARLQGAQRLRNTLPGNKILVIPRQRLVIICRQSIPGLQDARCITTALFGRGMRSVQWCVVTARPAQRLPPSRSLFLLLGALSFRASDLSVLPFC